MPLPPLPMGDWAQEFDGPVTRVDPERGRLPQRTLDRTCRAYYAQIAHIDYQIGRMVYFLRRQKWLANTCIIFLSDHGEMLGDHYQFAKSSPFEGSAKVPLIIRPADGSACRRGSRCELPVTHYDLMPTILQEAGLPIPATVEGASRIPWCAVRRLPGGHSSMASTHPAGSL